MELRELRTDEKRKSLYLLLACVSILFILRLGEKLLDRSRCFGILSHKSGLKRELNLRSGLMSCTFMLHSHVAMASGLINFSNRIFERSRASHKRLCIYRIRTSGCANFRIYGPYATGGKISSMGFNLLNMIWLVITITALVQIKRKRIVRHRNWMIRSYAFASQTC